MADDREEGRTGLVTRDGMIGVIPVTIVQGRSTK